VAKKKKETQDANSEIWLVQKFKEVEEKVIAGGTPEEIQVVFEEFFSLDTRGRWKEELQKTPQDILEGFKKLIDSIDSSRVLFPLWRAWEAARNRDKDETKRLLDRYAEYNFHIQDYLVLFLLNNIDEKYVFELYDNAKQSFGRLIHWCREVYWNNPAGLEHVGLFLEKLGLTNWDYTTEGKKFRARSSVLLAKRELTREIMDTVDSKVDESIGKLRNESESQSKKLYDEQDDKIKEIRNETGVLIADAKTELKTYAEERMTEISKDTAQETERRAIRNFVQIIGIFAAIIAFIVTIVPTAVRLGGASVPIALAGLAIVTVGIILVLATIFGKKEKPSGGLIAGICVTGALFVGWLLLTLGLAFVKPNVLAPPPVPERIDTLYIESSPAPTPSIEEGEDGRL